MGRPSRKRTAQERFLKICKRRDRFPPKEKSAKELVREGFRLFCDPSTEQQLTGGVLAEKRGRFFLSLGDRYRRPDTEIGSNTDEQLLALLQLALLASGFFQVREILMDQEENYGGRFPLLGKILSIHPLPNFLSDQRWAIADHLDRRRLGNFWLGDKRKKNLGVFLADSKLTTSEKMVIGLLVVCYRLLPKPTIASPLVKEILSRKGTPIYKTWKKVFRGEKDRERKVKARAFRRGDGPSLYRLESWLLKFWADPRLPLCAMGLNDIAEAARLSPDFEDDKGESANNPRSYVSAETIRKIQKRAALTRMHAPLVKNVRSPAKRKKRSSAEENHVWPCFDYDTVFDLDAI
ncbi:MAG: hypothetical protein WCH98_13530 [Verrucomicrobiota bacterium]